MYVCEREREGERSEERLTEREKSKDGEIERM